ncbi:hypothetical protein [Methylopila capsulata]|uniref:hypothetical protein n=1 Tax=Methylopila capsulata TaxID=61654 RepID=UPI0022F2CE0B|nr:hypothetical protein [Methylopila capsulata]
MNATDPLSLSLNRDVQDAIGQELKASYRTFVRTPLDGRMQRLLDELGRCEADETPAPAVSERPQD